MAQVTTKRDRPIFVHDGFMYRFAKRSADGGKLWRCSVTACLGRVKTDDNDVFIEIQKSNHSYPRDPDSITVKSVITTMKMRAESQTTLLGDIYCTETATLAAQPSAAAAMPTFPEVHMTLSCHRRKQFPTLPSPRTRQDIVVPDTLKTTVSGYPFLMPCGKENKFIIYWTADNLHLLCQSNIMCMDGTFDAFLTVPYFHVSHFQSPRFGLKMMGLLKWQIIWATSEFIKWCWFRQEKLSQNADILIA